MDTATSPKTFEFHTETETFGLIPPRVVGWGCYGTALAISSLMLFEGWFWLTVLFVLLALPIIGFIRWTHELASKNFEGDTRIADGQIEIRHSRNGRSLISIPYSDVKGLVVGNNPYQYRETFTLIPVWIWVSAGHHWGKKIVIFFVVRTGTAYDVHINGQTFSFPFRELHAEVDNVEVHWEGIVKAVKFSVPALEAELGFEFEFCSK